VRNPADFGMFEFIEAPAFKRYREHYLDDDAFAQLQAALMDNPEAGDLVPSAGGIRKLRWKDARRGKGKRGGLRIIYYCFLTDEEIWLLNLYDKAEASDLTKAERDQLRQALEAERAARRKGGKS
jgi:mRNA-degrading endonuclease RelE of RelBE toxin-antitoxin system